MRITNNIIMSNTKSNINANKVQVDKYNTQMSTQKKISRPSEDPVVAIRSLRLNDTFSEVVQYNDKNIPDANSWLDVTQTALTNMNAILDDVYKQCVNGSTDTLNEEDRSTILSSLNALREQVYAEGNSDYAGRTVFTGYKTDTTLTFMEDTSKYTYEIAEPISYDKFEDFTYLADPVVVPTTYEGATGVNPNKDTTTGDYLVGGASIPTSDNGNMPTSVTNTRLRLSYEGVELTHLESKDCTQYRMIAKNGNNYQYDATTKIATEENNAKSSGVVIQVDGVTFADGEPAYMDLQGLTYEVTDRAFDINSLVENSDGTFNLPENLKDSTGQYPESLKFTYVNASGTTVTATQGSDFSYDSGTGKITPTTSGAFETAIKDGKVENGQYTDSSVVVKVENISLTDWEKNDYNVPRDTVYLVKDTGELVFGKDVADRLKETKATVQAFYQKTSFETGELRPEMYFDCTRTDNDTKKSINYKKEVQEINYMVSSNQTMAINVEASNVFNADIGRDVDELANVVQNTIDAHEKVKKLTTMLGEDQYQDATSQENLKLWIAAAQKEADYYDERMQTLFEKGVGNFKEYMKTLNTQITELGNRGARLSLTKSRMTEQKATVEELKSTNEDRELSDIIIDYTAQYTAYQASLQAAGKLNQTKLLDYI